MESGDCDAPPCETDGECCDEKKQRTEECCKKEDSCLSKGEVDGLKDRYDSRDPAVRTPNRSYESPFSDRKFIEGYLNQLYGDDNPKRAECARKRKCLLVPYDDAGSVCCDEMTGHHVVPGSALRGSLSGCYDHGKALTVCLTGMTNHKGTHGAMHHSLKESVKRLRKQRDTPCKVKYSKMLSASVDSFDETTEGVCDRKCIEKELRENLKKQCPDAFKDGEPDVDAVWGNAAASEENLDAIRRARNIMVRGKPS